MRDLHGALAGIRCCEASWRLGSRELTGADESVRHLIAETAGHLGARGLLRDRRQIWRPVLGSPENLPGRVGTLDDRDDDALRPPISRGGRGLDPDARSACEPTAL
jgi:hypothetical protein